MSKKGFKSLPFTWRKDVTRNLKGVNLSVWLYHYWRTERDDETVVVTIPELVAELPYSKRHIEYSRAWLVANGWLVNTNPAQKGEDGRYTVPVYTVAVGNAAESHSVRVDASHPRAQKTHTAPMRKRRTPSTASLTHAQKTHSKETVLRGDSKVASQGKIVSESVNEFSASPSSPQRDWDQCPEPWKSEIRTLGLELKDRWEDQMYSILDVHTIYALCFDTCLKSGMVSSPKAVAVAIQHLLAIYESDRWSGRRVRPAEKSVAALRRWLENKPHDPPDGKTLREQLRNTLIGAIATSRDRRDAATPKGVPTVCPDCGSRMEHGFCDACAFPESEPETFPESPELPVDRSQFLATAKEMLNLNEGF